MSQLSLTSRTRWRVFAVVFAAIGVAATVFILRQPRWYEASAILQVKLDSEMGGKTQAPAEDMTTLLEVGKSNALIQKIEERLTESERAAFLLSHDHPMKDGYPLSVMEVIRDERRVTLGKAPRTLVFQVRDRDRWMAARLANLFAEELLGYAARIQIGFIPSVEDPMLFIEVSEKRIGTLVGELAAYREARRRESGGEFEPDTHSQEIEKRLIEERQRLVDLTAGARRIQALSEPPPNPVHVVAWATQAGENEHMKEPIRAALTVGFGIAALSGLVATSLARAFVAAGHMRHPPR